MALNKIKLFIQAFIEAPTPKQILILNNLISYLKADDKKTLTKSYSESLSRLLRTIDDENIKALAEFIAQDIETGGTKISIALSSSEQKDNFTLYLKEIAKVLNKTETTETKSSQGYILSHLDVSVGILLGLRNTYQKALEDVDKLMWQLKETMDNNNHRTRLIAEIIDKYKLIVSTIERIPPISRNKNDVKTFLSALEYLGVGLKMTHPVEAYDYLKRSYDLRSNLHRDFAPPTNNKDLEQVKYYMLGALFNHALKIESEGEFAEALALLRRIINEAQSNLENKNTGIQISASCYCQKGIILSSQNRYIDALASFKSALALIETEGQEDQKVLIVRESIACAISYYQKAYDCSDFDKIIEILKLICSLYDKIKLNEEDKKVRQSYLNNLAFYYDELALNALREEKFMRSMDYSLELIKLINAEPNLLPKFNLKNNIDRHIKICSIFALELTGNAQILEAIKNIENVKSLLGNTEDAQQAKFKDDIDSQIIYLKKKDAEFLMESQYSSSESESDSESESELETELESEGDGMDVEERDITYFRPRR